MMAMEYLGAMAECFMNVQASDGLSVSYPTDFLMDVVVDRLRLMRDEGREVHLVGNGGSAAVVAHAQNDFVKAAQTRARVHQDFPLQSAYANDCTYAVAWAKSLEVLMRPHDVLMAVSSSGESASILNAVEAARKRQAMVMTFSGFESTNRLRQLGDLNFYVPSSDYGYVELTHAALLHYVTDRLAHA
jgi:D-sedoheptulose 7-phosphate isomerase